MKMEGKKMEKDFVLQWGNRKGPRCFNNNKLRREKEKERRFVNNNSSKSTTTMVEKQLASSPVRHHLNRNSDPATNSKPRSSALISAEKEDGRYYATRGSGCGLDENTTKGSMEKENHPQTKEDTAVVWPRLFTTLSSKEKEQDFMAMKGCKLPQRPKKRAKLIQRSILLVSPGAWLSDLCQERYQVREKRTSKKKPRGLKAMGGMESDSERE